MAKVDLLCKKCTQDEKNNEGRLYIRSSWKIHDTIMTVYGCANCGTMMQTTTSIDYVMIPTYEKHNPNEFPTLEECAIRRRKNKEKLIDERQLEIPTD